ncbi:MAG: amidohydrolase family protein [Bacteroidota bacterium]
MRQILICLALLAAVGLMAQQTPAPPQKGSVLITNATVHLGTGKAMANAAVGFANGKITYVGSSPTPSNFDQVIDATGKHVYPGFIAANTVLGLVEVDAVRATRDDREVGALNPNVRSLIAYNTDSDVTPTVRSMGVLMAEIVPRGGRVSGQSSVVSLDAWNWEDAAYATDIAIHLNWPRAYSWSGWWAEPGAVTENKKYVEQIGQVESYLEEALAYTQSEPVIKNLKFEAMRGLFDGTKKLFVHVNQAKSIMDVVALKTAYNLDMVLVGGEHAYLVADLLKKHNIPVVLDLVQALPTAEDDDIDLPFRLPKMTHDAGLTFALSHENAWEQRNLIFQAGQAISYGLDYEQAVKSLSLAPAMIFGLDKTLGSIEKGKDATLFISSGDVFDARSSAVEQAFIQGRSIDVDNKQKALWRKFKAKYDTEK